MGAEFTRKINDRKREEEKLDIDYKSPLDLIIEKLTLTYYLSKYLYNLLMEELIKIAIRGNYQAE